MKRKFLLFTVLLGLLGAGGFMADRMLKGRNHAGLSKFLKQWWVNYPASFAVEPMELNIQVDAKDMEAMEAVVAAARERGVIMPEGNEFVPAQLDFDGTSFNAKLRIKGKMSDHVQGSKWSFRVVAKKDKGFLGMQRFSLQHPGTRNYLCDWFYHRLMRGEGIIALRYGFLRLKFNGEDLGIYAYEEHFGPELLANNGRLKGPLFRFDPGLFWEHRLNRLEGVRYSEAFRAYQAAAVDAFGSGDLEKDSAQRVTFEEAVSRMDAFRRGQLRASEVFDADKLGRRHAILDLVGGQHSMDWSDVKFYYDPVLKRIEPVAYESFSAFPIHTLAGSDRYIGKHMEAMDLHDAYFNDPDLFRSYVHHLERVSRPMYLDSAFTVLAPALDSASALIYREFPYKELDRTIYYKNQSLIRRILDVPKGFHAYFNGGTDTLRFTIVPVEGLPIEVHGLVADDGAILAPTTPVIVPCRMPDRMGVPLECAVVVGGKVQLAPGRPLRLRYSVLGASVQKELEVFPYGYLDGLVLPSVSQPNTKDIRAVECMIVDDSSHTIRFRPGSWSIAEDIVIPAGYTVKAIAPLRVDLVQGARIVSRSRMHWKGMEEAPIVITSTDHSGGGLLMLGTEGTTIFHEVRFEGFGPSASGVPSIVVQEGDVRFEHCRLAEVRTRDLLLVVRGKVDIKSCTFAGGKDQVTLAYCTAQVIGSSLNGAGDDALSAKGSHISVEEGDLSGAMGMGLKLDENAEASLKATRVSATKNAVAVSEGSTLRVIGGALASMEGVALNIDALHMRHGHSSVELTGVDLGGSPDPFKIGKGEHLLVDGKTVGSTTASTAK